MAIKVKDIEVCMTCNYSGKFTSCFHCSHPQGETCPNVIKMVGEKEIIFDKP